MAFDGIFCGKLGLFNSLVRGLGEGRDALLFRFVCLTEEGDALRILIYRLRTQTPAV